ncbi:MAG: hypothetical protein E6H77_03665 [Betaproteobacteria bacterium]|nr:MAG: hypothetical protein E6H77_03665 [Betaproteobacteria bacterium]
MPAFSTPLMVEPAVGALNQTSSGPALGVGVLLEVLLFATVTLMRDSDTPPFASYATARSVYVPSRSWVVGKLQFHGGE